MIKPRYNKFYRRFWSFYFKRIIDSDFERFSFDTHIQPDPERGILLIANHHSWWDGFWAYRLNDLHFKKRFHVMMLEEELKKRTFLTYAGAFSVEKGSRSVVESLNFSAELISDPQNTLLIFPQGRFQSVQERDFIFEKGVFRVLAKAKQKPQLIFSSAFPEYGKFRKPTVHIHLKEAPPGSEKNFDTLKDAFLSFQEEARTKQSKLLTDELM